MSPGTGSNAAVAGFWNRRTGSRARIGSAIMTDARDMAMTTIEAPRIVATGGTTESGRA
jgi:hypothetical protein